MPREKKEASKISAFKQFLEFCYSTNINIFNQLKSVNITENIALEVLLISAIFI